MPSLRWRVHGSQGLLWPYKASRKLYVAQAYTHVLENMKSASDSVTLPKVLPSSKLSLYKYFVHTLIRIFIR